MKYAYIDESGTREFQHVMAVSLVVLEGRRTGEKLHEKVMCELYADYVERRARLKKNKQLLALPDLHYAEMNLAQRERVARKLAAASIYAYVSYYYHDGKDTEHEQRFAIYTHLVKDVIRLATQNHNELSLVVAQQGGWQGYEGAMVAELRVLEHETGLQGQQEYRKLAVSLEPARNPGVQLADFYAGSCRDFIIHPDNELKLVHYRLIERQVRLELSLVHVPNG